MRDYKGFPVFEREEIENKKDYKIYFFKDGETLSVPPYVHYAFISEGDIFCGIVVSKENGNGFRKDEKEKIFIKLCPNFIGRRIIKSVNNIEARI